MAHANKTSTPSVSIRTHISNLIDLLRSAISLNWLKRNKQTEYEKFLAIEKKLQNTQNVTLVDHKQQEYLKNKHEVNKANATNKNVSIMT